MNLYHATAFIKHLITARSAAGHGVHSPFVFDFLTDVVRGNNDANLISRIESLRHEMMADNRTVRVTDLGAGSARKMGEERSISGIAYTAALPPGQVQLLARMAQGTVLRPRSSGRTGSEAMQSRESERELTTPGATRRSPARSESEGYSVHREQGDSGAQKRESQENQPHREQGDSGAQKRESQENRPHKETSDAVSHRGRGNVLTIQRTEAEDASYNSIILELGTSLGISTLALSLAAPEKRVVTVEGCPALAEIARENLLRHGATNVDVINMEFSEALDMLRHRGTTVSLAFIDGNHRGGALKQYAETIRSMGEEMLIVADDIHLSRDMYEAWQQLAESGIAPATIETFRFGILLCLNNLTPGRYRIRH